MKKRLLITSIVMMLVVAVALSTATYAWFTSNNQVTASQISIKATVSGATALGIGWADGEAGNSISFPNYERLSPMAPVSLEKGTTTTTVEDALVFKTSTIKQIASVYSFNAAGDVTTPVTYSNETAHSFYIRNLSPANSVSNITVTATFAADGTFIPTSDETYVAGTKYYTFAPAGEFNAETPYYTLASNVYTLVASPVAGDVGTYYVKTEVEYTEGNDVANGTYEEIAANDMIRIAIFTKEYKKASGTFVTGTTYYAYNTATDSFSVKDTTSYENGVTSVADLYTLDANFKLRGVLGQSATVGTAASTFDKNTTYYTRESSGTGYIYTQDKDVTATNFAEKDAVGEGLFTCENTAVYGAITENGAVKNLDHYTEVATSFTISDEELLPGEKIEIIAMAWLDGTVLDDDRASQLGQFGLEFTAA